MDPWLIFTCIFFISQLIEVKCQNTTSAPSEVYDPTEYNDYVYDIRGAVVNVFTPFDKYGNISYEMIPNYLNFLYENGIDAISVGGAAAEHEALSFEEHVNVMTAYLKEAKSMNMKVIINIPNAPMSHVMNMAKLAEAHGADALLVQPTGFSAHASAEYIVEYLEDISSFAPSLSLIYLHLQYTGITVNIREFYRLATFRISNFKGLKTILQDALMIQDLIQNDQVLYVVDRYMVAPIIAAGVDSCSGANLNIFPKTVLSIINATKNGDIERAVAMQVNFTRAMNIIIESGDAITAFKAAMKMVTGIDMGTTRQSSKFLKANAEQNMWDKLTALGVEMLGPEPEKTGGRS